jgi:hypothetical protein
MAASPQKRSSLLHAGAFAGDGRRGLLCPDHAALPKARAFEVFPTLPHGPSRYTRWGVARGRPGLRLGPLEQENKCRCQPRIGRQAIDTLTVSECNIGYSVRAYSNVHPHTVFAASGLGLGLGPELWLSPVAQPLNYNLCHRVTQGPLARERCAGDCEISGPASAASGDAGRCWWIPQEHT